MWTFILSWWRTLTALAYLAYPRILGIRPPSHIVNSHRHTALGVVLHGLRGDRSDTLHFYNGLMAQDRMAVFCPDLPNRCRGRLDDIVGAVLSPIVGHCTTKKDAGAMSKSIVLIGQSRGGIVAAQCGLLLRRCCPDWAVKVITISTPFFGSSRVNPFTRKPLGLYYGIESVEEISRDSTRLTQLRHDIVKACEGDNGILFEHYVAERDFLVPFNKSELMPCTTTLPLDGHYSAMVDVHRKFFDKRSW